MLKPVPLTANCLIKTDHSGDYALTWRRDDLDVHRISWCGTIRVEADLVDQLFNSSEKRLARALLLLANFGKDGRPEPIIAKVSQETLAEMIGTTRSRVSYFMNKFRKLGLIDYNGRIEIHTSLLNVVLHEEPHISV
jgi:hypothetical protein